MVVKAILAFLFLCGSTLGLTHGNASPRLGIRPVSNPFKPVLASESAPRPHVQIAPFRTSGGPLVEALRSNRDGPNEDGSYSFSFETSDGIKREEQGQFTIHGTYAVSGSYSYTAPDGTLVEVKYVADENGYRAESPLIPAIPEHSLGSRPSSSHPSPQPQPFSPVLPRPQPQPPRPQPQPQPPRPQPQPQPPRPQPQPLRPQPQPQPPRPQPQPQPPRPHIGQRGN